MEYFEIERDIEKFLNDKIVVNCKTEEDAEEFLNFLESKYQIKWFGGQNLIDNSKWTDCYDQTCYKFDNIYSSLFYSNICYYKDYKNYQNYQILVYKKNILMKELLNQKPIVESKLNIKSSKKRRIFIIENNE